MKKFILPALLIFTMPYAFSVEPKVSKEERQKMADMHSKMASCLKSDRPMSECRNEMMSSCQKMMGEDGCPMMGKKGMMRGMKGKGKMQKEAQEDEE